MICRDELQQLLDSRAAVVLLVALRQAHAAGDVFALPRTDAPQFRMSERTFVDAREVLVRRGFVRCASTGRPHQPNQYSLAYPCISSGIQTTSDQGKITT